TLTRRRAPAFPYTTLFRSVESAAKHRFSGVAKSSELKRLAEVSARDLPRMESGIEELDRVLGGGFVAGEVALLGGEATSPATKRSEEHTSELQSLTNLVCR